MFHGMDGYGMGWSWSWILSLVVLIIIVVIVVNAINRNKIGPGNDVSALDILKERYSRGEINKEEYEKIKNDL